jgi:hypothetical protein
MPLRPRVALRAALLLDWLLLAAVVIGMVVVEYSGDTAGGDVSEDFTSGDLALLALALLLLAGNFVGSIGLWFFQRWSRWLYTGTLLAMTALTFLDEPAAVPAWIDGLSEIGTLLCGVIVALSFYAPIEWRPPQPAPSSP